MKPSVFTALLLVVFVALKLTGVIDWSWWWVLTPLTIPVGLAVVGLILFGLVRGARR